MSASQNRSRKVPPSANHGAIVDLLSGVERQPRFSRMVSYSMQCLKQMAVSDVTAEEMVETGAVNTLHKGMALHPDNQQLHKQYMETIHAFTRNPQLAASVGKGMNHNFACISHSLKNHNDLDTHISTARAMAALAVDHDNLNALIDQGALDALATLMKKHPDNPDLMAAGAKVFSTAARHRPKEVGQFMLESGTAEAIMRAMQLHPGHEELARNGVELLAVLAGNADAEMLKKLQQLGAIDALLAALEARPHDRQLEEWARQALKALTGENDMVAALSVCKGDMASDAATARSLATVAALLLVDSNIDTLWRHSGAAWLLSVLSNAAAAGDDGGLDANGQRILINACRALMRATNDANHAYDIIRNKGVQLLVSVLNSQSDMDTLAAALGALSSLIAGREEHARYVVKHHGLNAALRAYAQRPNDIEVVRPVLSLLSSCSEYESCASGMVAAGCIEALIDMFKRHIHDAAIVKDAINTLGRLATSAENVKRMGTAGLLPLLLQALKRHGDDPDVVRAALLALETAALLPENIPELVRLGAIPAVHAALMRFSQDRDIQDIGRRLLNLLCQEEERKKAEEEAMERERREAEERRRKEEEERRREEEERKQLEKEMAEALAQLKLQDAREEEERQKRRAKEQEERERRRAQQQKEWEDNIKLKEMRKKEEESRRSELEKEKLLPVTSVPAVVPHRSARAIFDSEDEVPAEYQLPAPVRQFLLAGSLLTKHSKTALPASKHVYVSHDLTLLIWNKPMTDILSKNTMAITSLHAVTRGKCTPQLQRVRFGIPLAGHESHCFSILGVSGDGEERTVDLEAKTAADRDRWVDAIEHLIKWVKSKKLYGSSTVHMTGVENVVKEARRELAKGK